MRGGVFSVSAGKLLSLPGLFDQEPEESGDDGGLGWRRVYFSCLLRYEEIPSAVGLSPSAPSFQLAGQTSPYFSVN